MNIGLEPPPTDLDQIESTAAVNKLDDTAAALEARLQSEIDGRKEDRFWALFIAAILLDAIIFPQLGASSILIFLLQLIGLGYAAKRLGIDFVVVALGKLYERAMRMLDKKD